MIQLNNPSVTSPRAGSRSRNKSPRDTTGRRYEELHREAEAKKSAANIDINEVRRAEFSRGWDKGYAKGFNAGWDSLAAHLVEIGVLAPDEPDEDELSGGADTYQSGAE